MIIEARKEKQLVTDMRSRMEDVLVSVSWLDIANRYFGKSSSWLYQKMDGKNSNGSVGGFTPDEADRLRGALCDLADRIRRCAERI